LLCKWRARTVRQCRSWGDWGLPGGRKITSAGLRPLLPGLRVPSLCNSRLIAVYVTVVARVLGVGIETAKIPERATSKRSCSGINRSPNLPKTEKSHPFFANGAQIASFWKGSVLRLVGRAGTTVERDCGIDSGKARNHPAHPGAF
jgi:hypothetical protein